MLRPPVMRLIGVVTVIVFLVGLTLWYVFGGTPDGALDRSPVVVPYERVDEWVPQVAQGKNPVFLRKELDSSSAADETPTALHELKAGQSLGRLEGQDLSRLNEMCNQQVSLFDEALVRAREKAASNGATAADIAEEGRLAYLRELAITARDAVLAGDYFVVTQETANMLTQPPDCGKQTMSCSKNGQPAIAVVLPSYQKYPALAAAKEYQNTTKLWNLDEICRDFNAKEFATRQRAIARYEALQEKRAANENVTQEDRAFMLRQFPPGTRLDKGRALLHIIR